MKSGSVFIHSLFFALVISLFFLLIAKPPNDINLETDNISCVFIYFAIFLISFFSILLYAAIMAYLNMNKCKS